MSTALAHRIKSKVRSVFRRLRSLSCSVEGKSVVVKSGEISGLRVHLGAGPINLAGWLNIDAREASHIHLVANNFELSEFADGTLAEIYMCHVLEHFSFEEADQLLRNFRKKLKPGGLLRISVPNFDHLVKVYQANGNDLEIVRRALMGGQDYEYNFHKSIYNKAHLSSLLVACGYVNPREWTTLQDFGVDIGDWSSRNFDTPSGSFPISLNIKSVSPGT